MKTKKNTTTISETQLRNMIAESVKKVLKEVRETERGRFIEDSRNLLNSLKGAERMINGAMQRGVMPTWQNLEAREDGKEAMLELISSLVKYGQKYLHMDGYELAYKPYGDI